MTASKKSLQLDSKKEIRLLGMLGFAMRAGKLIIGTELVCRAMAKGTPRLVLVSDAASGGTKKKLTVKCEFYGIPCKEIPLDGERLGKLLGKSSTPMAVAVTDSGFSNEIIKALEPEKT